MDNYLSVTAVYENFSADLPDVIIDDTHSVERIFNRIPALGRLYKQTQPGVYEKK